MYVNATGKAHGDLTHPSMMFVGTICTDVRDWRQLMMRKSRYSDELASNSTLSSFTSNWLSISHRYHLTSHSTHNRSSRRWVFPGNQLHWYRQPKTRKQKHCLQPKHKREMEKSAPANKTIYALVLYTSVTTTQHDGECDMLKYICSKVEMSTWGLARVLTFQLRDIYICLSHESIMRHLFCRIID